MYNIKPKTGGWTPELEKRIAYHLTDQQHLVARFMQVPVVGASSRNLPRNLWSADLYIATPENPLTPAYRALERFVRSGELVYIDETKLLV